MSASRIIGRPWESGVDSDGYPLTVVSLVNRRPLGWRNDGFEWDVMDAETGRRICYLHRWKEPTGPFAIEPYYTAWALVGDWVLRHDEHYRSRLEALYAHGMTL
jgi:hypothetical protein